MTQPTFTSFLFYWYESNVYFINVPSIFDNRSIILKKRKLIFYKLKVLVSENFRWYKYREYPRFYVKKKKSFVLGESHVTIAEFTEESKNMKLG